MKTLLTLGLLLTLGAVIPAGTAFASEGRIYENSRFGFSLAVPLGNLSLVESENGDGITIRYREGMVLRAYASLAPLVFGRDYNALCEEAKTYFDEITYSRLNEEAGWYGLSGYKDGQIVYIKTFAGKEMTHTVEMTYPKETLKRYNEFVRLVVDSFVPGPLGD